MRIRYRSIAIFFLVCFSLWSSARLWKVAVFTGAVANRVNNALHATNPQLAVTELDQVIQYLNQRGLTSGNTGIFIGSADGDIDFWYQNLVSARDLLASNEGQEDFWQTRKELIETLGITPMHSPFGISVYAQGTTWRQIWFWSGWAALLMFVIGITFLWKDNGSTYVTVGRSKLKKVA
ncbi:hypothetical protein CO174_03830 [Candidatus Uhrbacteria bacterium CG_4_9_14_3_um_filter_50_9]|uniref:Uncharacterized protein n=1 Tax=Candidatus Uhrbacteria bacterium CG_4_9_14_3_um_filter_50_9 TaxID=1975035 RepID=A0A2M7XBL8_9BACT|nr:MAG: hypothetical protein CO174_03830 [Candidatus Uhrbacteria bacterium CG_4_9_14_3_um_filter_50_9]